MVIGPIWQRCKRQGNLHQGIKKALGKLTAPDNLDSIVAEAGFKLAVRSSWRIAAAINSKNAGR